MRALAGLIVLVAACGSFENPAIVIDLRVLAMTAVPPEQVVPFDPTAPLAVDFAPVEVCALVADPGVDRALSWSMTACSPKGDRRCDAPERPTLELGGGELADPETAPSAQVACAIVPGGIAVFPILQDTIERDALSGFGGVDINVMVRVVPAGGDETEAVYGSKAVRFSPKVPDERVANNNPILTVIATNVGDGMLPLGRCIDQAAPVTLRPLETIRLEPVEPPGVREEYVVPTFEGGVRTFTENLRYQWLAGAGDWTRNNTGGPRDLAGNEPPLDTAWEAPEDVGAGAKIPLWLVQRDERGGARWYQSCVNVVP